MIFLARSTIRYVPSLWVEVAVQISMSVRAMHARQRQQRWVRRAGK